jgi:hypothetical protein
LDVRVHGETAGKQGGNQRIEIGLVSEPQVDVLEPGGGLEHQRRGVVTPIACKSDSTQKNVQLCTLQVIQRPAIGDGSKSERRVQSTGEALGLGGAKCSGGSTRWVNGQRHGSLQKGGRSGETAARLRARRRLLQLGRYLFVGHRRGLCTVPCAAIRVDLRIGCIRQCSVNHAPLARFGCAVHR